MGFLREEDPFCREYLGVRRVKVREQDGIPVPQLFAFAVGCITLFILVSAFAILQK